MRIHSLIHKIRFNNEHFKEIFIAFRAIERAHYSSHYIFCLFACSL